jgi:hypothetical protein
VGAAVVDAHLPTDRTAPARRVRRLAYSGAMRRFVSA